MPRPPFTESNTVEALIRDLLCGGLGWRYIGPANLPRTPHEVLVEEHLRDALIRLNPSIAAQPDRADEVLYRLRAIVMTVRETGLVKANEEFAAWLLGERSMPFGEDDEHVTIRLSPSTMSTSSRTSLSSRSSSSSAPARRRSGRISCCLSTACRSS
jgi:hypothetical protein